MQPVSGARTQHDQSAVFYLNHLVLVQITHDYAGLWGQKSCMCSVSSPSLFLLDSRMEVQWSTWGSAAWTSSQREMLWMASDRAGDSPWSLFSTSTRSKDWRGGGRKKRRGDIRRGTEGSFFAYLNVPHGLKRGKALWERQRRLCDLRGSGGTPLWIWVSKRSGSWRGRGRGGGGLIC